MNVAFKHLEAKLRFGELSVGQWASVLAGVLFALAVAQLLSPVGGLWAVVIGVYLGAIPASAALFASLSEFDLLGLCAAAVRWRRACGQYLPGAGDTTTGYVVRRASPDRSAEPRVELGRIDQLWALEPETQP